MLTQRSLTLLSAFVAATCINTLSGLIVTRGPELVEKDGAYYIKIFCPENRVPFSLDTDSSWTSAAQQKLNQHYVPVQGILDIRRNNVGLNKLDTCGYAEIASSCAGFNPQRLIVCKSGRVFSKIDQSTRASNGTPGNVRLRNYIGDINVAESTRRSAGLPSNKTISFCDGPCKVNS